MKGFKSKASHPSTLTFGAKGGYICYVFHEISEKKMCQFFKPKSFKTAQV